MAALAPIPQETFKRILELYGFRLEEEDEDNWTLSKEDAQKPIITIPKRGAILSVGLMMKVLDQLKIDNKKYFELLQKTQH